MRYSPIYLVDCEAGLVQSAVPAWVFDAETIQFVWANELAVELWQAPNRAELLARDIIGGVPERVLARTRSVVERVRAGAVLREEWAFYPRGKPTMVLLDLRAVTLPDGRLGVLNQALSLVDAEPTSLHRAVTMARHSTVISALVDPNARILSQNPSALIVFGELDSWVSWFSDATEAEEILHSALENGSFQAQVRVSARGVPRWHRVDAQALRDPVSGELGALVEHSDETARIEAENLAESRGQHIAALSAIVALVEPQRRELFTLSAPNHSVEGQTLTVPLVGRLRDTQSSVAFMTALLNAVCARNARHIILDMAGVEAVDEASASRFHQLVRALRLIGATPTITGVCTKLALELAACGVDLEGTTNFGSFAEGLRRAK